MFTAIEPHIYEQWDGILDQIYRLRKKTFHDALKWDVPVDGDYERDVYDDVGPVYLTWHDPAGTKLYGTMRLMPTTGPTLLYDVFSDTFPDAAQLSAPGIWEATRTCVHIENLKSDFPHIPTWKAFGLIMLASAECGLQSGIHTIVSNYEPPLKRIYDRSGAIGEELGRSDGYGRQPVCCGVFEVSERAVDQMSEKLGISGPIFDTPEIKQALAA